MSSKNKSKGIDLSSNALVQVPDSALSPVAPTDIVDSGVDFLKQKTTSDALNEAAKEGKILPRVLVLEEGEMFRGVVMGPGPIIEVRPQTPDPLEPNKMNPVTSWHLRHESGVEVYLMSAYQLDKEIGGAKTLTVEEKVIDKETGEPRLIKKQIPNPDYPLLGGHDLTIAKGQQKNNGSRRVNQFMTIDHGDDTRSARIAAQVRAADKARYLSDIADKIVDSVDGARP